MTNRADVPSESDPFETIYPRHELSKALRAADLALLWGRCGQSALLRQAFLPRPRRRLVYFSYVWEPPVTPSLRQRSQAKIAQRVARLARAVVLMTAEQADAARATLPHHVPVIDVQVGIDCRFYAHPGSLSDVAKQDRARVERLLLNPYVIMPGDELRLNADALTIVENTQLILVRVSQYGHKNNIQELKREIRRRNIGDRLLVFERISYPALRFLMKNAIAYAGLVDATWQPAGWTVACECLACGLPIVLYEGLTSREIGRLGASSNILRSVPTYDTKAFSAELQSFVTTQRREDLRNEASAFAVEFLDLERTGAAFGRRLAQAAHAR
jgi:glycosyltransferase involved in cell wall biosynthesis